MTDKYNERHATYEVLTVKEAAKLLKTSRTQIRKMIRLKLLHAVRVGREYRIPLETIVEFAFVKHCKYPV